MVSFKEVQEDYLAAVDGGAPDNWADGLEEHFDLAATASLLRSCRLSAHFGKASRSIAIQARTEILNLLQAGRKLSQALGAVYADESGLLFACVSWANLDVVPKILEGSPITGIETEMNYNASHYPQNDGKFKALLRCVMSQKQKLRGLKLHGVDECPPFYLATLPPSTRLLSIQRPLDSLVRSLTGSPLAQIKILSIHADSGRRRVPEINENHSIVKKFDQHFPQIEVLRLQDGDEANWIRHTQFARQGTLKVNVISEGTLSRLRPVFGDRLTVG